MLSSDRQINKVFDINNLFLNLDFQKQEETFQYKHAILDHPSNYQCIVTKLLTRTSLPYIKLHESKKRNIAGNKPEILPNRYFFYDYMVKMTADVAKQEENQIGYRLEITNPLRRRNLTRTTYNPERYVQLVEYYNEKYKSFIEPDNDYNFEINFGGAFGRKNQYWINSGIHKNIYSLRTLYQMLDFTINICTNDLFSRDEWKTDPNFLPTVNLLNQVRPIFITVEENIPKLYIMDELSTFMLPTTNFRNQKEGDQWDVSRRICLFVQKSLYKYFKGLPFSYSSDFEGEFCRLDLTNTAADSVIKLNAGKKTYNYRVYTGEKINIMEVSDYIGLAITTPDFPVKEQNYPHFDFDFDKDFFTKNRRHYIPKTEENIRGIYNIPVVEGNQPSTFKREYISDQINSFTGNKILFLKYFGKDEDLNCINYENNDGNTSLKMDLMNVMPLQKFTLRLYLIDRYNNLEPLHPQIEGFEDVIKLQLLFTRIKGEEKENRNFIETELKRPQKLIVDFEKDMKEEEEEEEEEEEIFPGENNIIFIPYIPEQQQEEEEKIELGPPPVKKIFISENNDQDEIEDEIEDEEEEEERMIDEEEEEEEENDPEKNIYLNNEEEEEETEYNPEIELY